MPILVAPPFTHEMEFLEKKISTISYGAPAQTCFGKVFEGFAFLITLLVITSQTLTSHLLRLCDLLGGSSQTTHINFAPYTFNLHYESTA